jgi:hypothetical protein
LGGGESHHPPSRHAAATALSARRRKLCHFEFPLISVHSPEAREPDAG